MDLVSLAFTFLMQNPDLAAASAKQITRPGKVDVVQIQASFADLARGILNCYHRTARYQLAEVVEQPWARQQQYGAERSMLMQIRYFGVSGTKYEMVVALLGKDKSIRTAVLQDTALIRYSKRCQLEQWTKIGP